MEECQLARRCVHRAKAVVKDIFAHPHQRGDLVWLNIRNVGLRHTESVTSFCPST
jgi:hypothetical protein